VPQFVDVAWMVATPEYKTEWKYVATRAEKHSKAWDAAVDAVNANAPHYAKRIDLKPIITQEVVEKVRSHSQNTQLKLIITFNNDDVDIQAIAYQWRR
jgi:hypothetical protein